jgi:hypothetical protein
MSIVHFESTLTPPTATAETADVVIRTGKVFEVGEYPDKQFSLSEEEADEAVAAFVPVPGDIEHPRKPTVLGGKVGVLRRVWRDGKALFGEIQVPAWLDPLIAEEGRKVSLAWNRLSKRIEGWGWVTEPRISDAALFSAYAEFAGKRHSAGDLSDMQSIHDLSVRQGAACAAEQARADYSSAATPEKEKSMSFAEKVKAWFNQGMPSDFDERDPGDENPPTPEPATEAPASEAPEAPVEPSAEFTALQEENRRLKLEAVQRDAEAFADEQIRANRAFPAEREYLVAAFARASVDDEQAPQVVVFTRSQGEISLPGRVPLLRALVEARPAHSLTNEEVKAAVKESGHAVLFAKSETQGEGGEPMSEERRNRLLAMTLEGRAALKAMGVTVAKNGH